MMKKETLSKVCNFILGELEWLAEGASISFSRGSMSHKLALMDGAYAQWEINKALRYAKERGFLIEKNKKYVISEKGRKWIDHNKFKNLNFEPNKKWDKLWRMVIFDIPESERAIRDLLRNKLFDWQCTKLQQSVFITPYDCKKELQELAQALSSETYMHVFVLSDLDQDLESKLMKIYKLS